MGDINSKNPNTQGSKAYRDSIIGKITDADRDTVFTPANEAEVKIPLEDVVADEAWVEQKNGNIAPQYKAGNPNLEKLEEGKRHSFEYPNDPSSEVIGQKSSGQTKVANLDKPADTNKNVY